MSKFSIAADYCPNCKKTIDAAIGAGDKRPSKGDLTICAYCGHLCKYDEDLRLDLLTEEEKLDYKRRDPEAWAFVVKTISLIQERNG